MTFCIMEDDGPACCMLHAHATAGSLGIRKGDPVTRQGERLDEEVRWKLERRVRIFRAVSS